jgi:hypothetical protein
MKLVRREPGSDGYVMPTVRRLRKKIPSRPKNALHFAKNVYWLRQMFQNVVRDHEIERCRRIRNFLATTNTSFIQVRVRQNPRIRIDTGNLPNLTAKVHLRQSPGTCT